MELVSKTISVGVKKVNTIWSQDMLNHLNKLNGKLRANRRRNIINNMFKS